MSLHDVAHVQKFFSYFQINERDYIKAQGENLLHREVLEDFQKMENAAKSDGVNLTILSSTRNFAHQLAIWNGKASGERVIRDDHEMIVNISDLTQVEIMGAILRFIAVPGLSRHHFGTDIDLYDKTVISKDYRVSLVASEYQDGGPFANLSQWLIQNCENFGFYLPYSHDEGKLAREPWHISHRAMALRHTAKMTYDFMLPFYEQFTAKEFQLVDQVKEHLEQIIADYVTPY